MSTYIYGSGAVKHSNKVTLPGGEICAIEHDTVITMRLIQTAGLLFSFYMSVYAVLSAAVERLRTINTITSGCAGWREREALEGKRHQKLFQQPLNSQLVLHLQTAHYT